MLTRNRPKKFKVGLVGRTRRVVQLNEVAVVATDTTHAEYVALRIFRKVYPKARWEAVAL